MIFGSVPKYLEEKSNGEEDIPANGKTLGLKSNVSDALTLLGPILGISDENLCSL